MKHYLCVVLAAATLAACSSPSSKFNSKDLLASSDFESVEGWNGDAPVPPSLTREKAHSGSYSMRVGPDVAYASGFIGALNKFSPSRLTKVKVRAWVFVPEGQPGGAVVTQLMDPATNQGVLWEALNLDESNAKRNEWVQVEKTVTLPANTGPTFKLYVYLWSGNTPTIAYIDDMEIIRVK